MGWLARGRTIWGVQHVSVVCFVVVLTGGTLVVLTGGTLVNDGVVCGGAAPRAPLSVAVPCASVLLCRDMLFISDSLAQLCVPLAHHTAKP